VLATHYLLLRNLHVGCAALSGTLFALRGALRIRGVPWANHRALRAASYAIDTTLLCAAILLMLIIHQYPFIDPWLTVKVSLLVLYIGLGLTALKWARTSATRSLAFAGALLTFCAIVAVAVAHYLGHR